MVKDKDALKIVTVTGPLDPARAGVTDAHNHTWIRPLPGVTGQLPVLDDQARIEAELEDYRSAGGGTQVDCQPGAGCGRDGAKMRQLSQASQVNIVGSTGFHLPKYYPRDYWLFSASADAAQRHFVSELTQGMEETVDSTSPVLAGFIKIACPETIQLWRRELVEAAVAASRETGAAIEVHTEKGAEAERIVNLLFSLGLTADRLVLCHVDKRPDFGLHRSLAQANVMLEYDTFFRPKYDPERNLWPLLRQMASAGLDRSIALATDMAETTMWARFGGAPGLAALLMDIKPRLEREGFSAEAIEGMIGKNIARRLARPALN